MAETILKLSVKPGLSSIREWKLWERPGPRCHDCHEAWRATITARRATRGELRGELDRIRLDSRINISLPRCVIALCACVSYDTECDCATA